MKFAKFWSALLILIPYILYAQNPPSDFKLVGTTGGIAPWTESETITILANGQVHFFSSKGGVSPQILLDTSFTINNAQTEKIWQAIQTENFFSLNSDYKDDTVKGGSIALFTITANGTTKQVKVKNTGQQEIQNIISTINSNIPADYNLNYTPPEKINIIPQDPCSSISGSSFSIDKKNFSKSSLDKIQMKYKTIASVKDAVQIPHGGVEIGYEESLYDAVGNGSATLTGKGGFYGDDVSIFGNNYNNFTPPDNNTIHIKLNLEFYGPCDNDANELKIVKDIYKKWNGVTTSSGKKIQMDIGTLSHPGASMPPGTAGFDDIKLACGKGTSVCDNLGTPNSGVVGGTWYPSDKDAGTFGHEAGHLMGLDDQYSSFVKQSDGSWLNEQDNTTKYSASDFLNLYHSKHPGDNLSDDQKFLNSNQRAGWPSAGHENDLMGDESKPPLQSDIDKLAAQAGLIIDINPGDILVNTGDYQQNFVVNHSGSLFLNPGETRTLDGIYAACIDHFLLPPDSAVIFAVAPPLDKWSGINAAQPLLKLVKYIDSLGYYCNIFDDYFAQEAIWKISDNAMPFEADADTLLMNAGVDINQTFDFPKMTYNLQNSGSSRYIPDQLFAADIEPKNTDAKINGKVNFTAGVSAPSVGNFITSFTWILNSPNSNSDQIAADGSNASLTPLQKGVYSLNLNVTVKDSTGSQRNFQPAATSYAIVPDKYTETFEHNNLTDLFSWKTYGDVQWAITNKTAQTGSFSIKSGNIGGNQSSILEISIDLPADSSIEFAVKTDESFLTTLGFYIDSLIQDGYDGFNDWTFKTYQIPAGKHILKWIYQNYGIAANNNTGVWLDNIFFPTNAAHFTSVESAENIPSTFNLFQNYPNPFNPITNIKYSLAQQSFVKLILYDLLGRKITDLFVGEQSAGLHEINFNASTLSSGVYLYSIEADYSKGKFINVKKMILLK